MQFRRISLSTAIKEEFRKKHGDAGTLPFSHKTIRDWRQQLQDIGDEKRNEALDYWVKAALSQNQVAGDLVIDGIRNLGEIESLRKQFANCYIMAVVAPKSIRWDRVAEDYGKDLVAFERDDRRDADEDLRYGQQVEKCVQEADYVVWNEDDLRPSNNRDKQLGEKLAPNVRLMRGESPRYPTGAETYIASAYAASHSSRCLKRFVGAVIVGENGVPLSLGYNENPVGMKPCELQYRCCFKDANMETKLEECEKVHCPSCGEKTSHIKRPWRCTKCGGNLKLALFPSRNMELCTAIHAEERAIRSLGDRTSRGATMYVTTFPCFQCARYIVDAGITKVVYVEAYPVREAADYLRGNGVAIEPFEGFKARAFNRIFKQRE